MPVSGLPPPPPRRGGRDGRMGPMSVRGRAAPSAGSPCPDPARVGTLPGPGRAERKHLRAPGPAQLHPHPHLHPRPHPPRSRARSAAFIPALGRSRARVEDSPSRGGGFTPSVPLSPVLPSLSVQCRGPGPSRSLRPPRSALPPSISVPPGQGGARGAETTAG